MKMSHLSPLTKNTARLGPFTALLLLVYCLLGGAAVSAATAAVPPPPILSAAAPNTTTLRAQLAATADQNGRAAILAKATLAELIALAREERAALLKGAKSPEEARARIERVLPPVHAAPVVGLEGLTPAPIPPAFTNPPPQPPSPEERAKRQQLEEARHAHRHTTDTAAEVPSFSGNHSAGAPPQRRAFAAAAFEIGPGAASYVVLPGTYWVRFSNGFYMCAFDDNTMRQSPRMYGWERITVLPGPTPGTSFLYTYSHNKYIIDGEIFINSDNNSPFQSASGTHEFESIDDDYPNVPYIRSREVRIEGAPVNAPRVFGQFQYRVASPRIDWIKGTFAYLRAPTAGEYHYFVYLRAGEKVPPPEIDFTSVRTLGAGEFWVRTHHGQFMCVFPNGVGPTGAQLAWERIRVIKADEYVYGRNRYHLWSDAQQRYLSFHHTGLALSTNTQSWETFRIVSHPKHFEMFSIFSDYHGKFLRQACHGCGFDASLSNTDAQNGDVTAFDFMPISWFSHVPFGFINIQAKSWRFDVTGKFINFYPNGLKQDIHPFGIKTYRLFDNFDATPTYSGYCIYHNDGDYSTPWFMLDKTLSIVTSNQVTEFHDIIPHPKIPNRYAVRLCYACPQAWYLAAHPDASTVTATEDGASDYTAIEIIF